MIKIRICLIKLDKLVDKLVRLKVRTVGVIFFCINHTVYISLQICQSKL